MAGRDMTHVIAPDPFAILPLCVCVCVCVCGDL
jgi:hypothetical protein